MIKRLVALLGMLAVMVLALFLFGPNQWRYTIKKLDLSDPEEFAYAKKLRAMPSAEANPYEHERDEVKEDPWETVYGPLNGNGERTVKKRVRPWTDEAELVTHYPAYWRYPSEQEASYGEFELVLRNKATGETDVIAECTYGSYLVIREIMNDTYLCFAEGAEDIPGEEWLNFYNRVTGEKTLVLDTTCSLELDDEVYLWRKSYFEENSESLRITDLRKLAAGEKDAEQVIASWDKSSGYELGYFRLSPDKRFVFLDMQKLEGEDYSGYRWIYDLEKEEEVAFFQLPTLRYPNSAVDNKLLSKNMEYYSRGRDFYVIRYKP